MCVGAPPASQEQETRYTIAKIYGSAGGGNDPMVRRNNAAIANVQARIDANEDRISRNNPLVPGGAVTGALYSASNFFNANIIDALQRGGTPVMDTSGNVTGSRDANNRLTGRDLAAEAAEAKRQQRQQQDDQDELRRAQERAAAQPKPPAASATAPPVPNTNRRPIIYEDQALSGASSRGPGRRSLLG